MRKLILIVIALSFFATASTCRRRVDNGSVTVALPEKFSTLDALTTPGTEAATERVKTLIFNSLVKKDTNFDYVGELAENISPASDGNKITFTLRDGVKFHDGKLLTSADVKYTLEYLLASKGAKAGSFFDTVADPMAKTESAPVPPAANTNTSPTTKPATKTKRLPHIESIEVPNAKTVVITIVRQSLRDTLLSNLVAVPIIPDGTGPQQKDAPIGTGPFKFESVDPSLSILELNANPDYWDGAPKFPKLRLKVLTDASSLQSELQSGGVDISPNPSNLQPDVINALSKSPNLKVDKFDGSNIQYVLFNTKEGPLANPKIRQAIGFAIDRKRIISDLILDQARIADAVLPPESWAFAPGTQYSYDPAKAKQLVVDSGYKNEPIVFKYRAGGAATNQYSQVIQSSLTDVGLNVQIETLDGPTLISQLGRGQFQMYTGIWVGGNTDPIFMRDLFSSTKIPNDVVGCCNRGHYTNTGVDKLIQDAINATDKESAKRLYVETWNAVSSELPLLPLWYPANIVVSNKRIGNVKMSGSGDWGFLKDITLSN